MTNLDFYGNNLLNIINGECPENNPLKYFINPETDYDNLNIKEITTLDTINNYGIAVWEKKINLIYTFIKEENKIKIISINKETNEIEKTYIINNNVNNLKQYYLYIVENTLFYTYIDEQMFWTWLGVINLNEETEENVIDLTNTENRYELKKNNNSDCDKLLTPIKLDLEFYHNNVDYLYIKSYFIFKNCIMRYSIETKEKEYYLLEEKLCGDFTFTICGDNTIYIIDNNCLKKYFINNETTTLISKVELKPQLNTIKKMEIVDGILYISNITINNSNYLVAYEVNSLKQIWIYETEEIKDFKILYNDIFIIDNLQLKKIDKNKCCLKLVFDLKDIISFEVSRDSNIYVLIKNKVNLLVPKTE
jgi:hypothetical protein